MSTEMRNGDTKTVTWLEDKQFDDLEFCRVLKQRHGFRWIGGSFYDPAGNPVADCNVQWWFIDELRKVYRDKLQKRSRELMQLAQCLWAEDTFEEFPERDIHLCTGTYNVERGIFSPNLNGSIGRLSVRYDRDAPKPECFLEYLDGLLEPEDIVTLQEYLGYCLIRSTKAQKMLIITGKGGEGKSVLGKVMSRIWGNTLVFNSIKKISTNAFARADLENKLVMVDDDMSLEALTSTNYLKTLITLETKTDVERKGVQSYQTQLYARFLGFSNGTLTALYDRSHGFYRRLIILKAKERPADRVDNPYVAECIADEGSGILNWALEGLNRLQENGYQFTISRSACQNLEATIRDADPIEDFLNSTGYLSYDPRGMATTADLYATYKVYCEDNLKQIVSAKTFERQVKEKLLTRGCTASTHIPGRQRSIRGYVGIRLSAPPGWQ